MAVVVAVAWLARRPLVIAASLAAAAAAATSYGFSHDQTPRYLVTQLVCLAAVVVLTGGTGYRSPAWLWLTGTVVAAMVLPGLLPALSIPYRWWNIIPLSPYLGVIVVAVAWAAIDARLLAAVATSLLLGLVPMMLTNLAAGIGDWFDEPGLLVAAAMAALAVWRLRRQSRQPGQARQ